MINNILDIIENPKFQPVFAVEVSGSRRRRSSNQVTDEMLTETVEGGHISAVPMNSHSQDDILRCSSQSS